MDLRPITDKQKSQYNKLVTHVIQSWEWGEFRKSLEIPVLRYGLYKNTKLTKAFQLTLHKIPFTNQYVGYLPKGPFPDQELAEALKKIGRENNCAFIKVEPDITTGSYSVIASKQSERGNLPISLKIASSMTARNDNTLIPKGFIPSPKPLFTKYNFI